MGSNFGWLTLGEKIRNSKKRIKGLEYHTSLLNFSILGVALPMLRLPVNLAGAQPLARVVLVEWQRAVPAKRERRQLGNASQVVQQQVGHAVTEMQRLGVVNQGTQLPLPHKFQLSIYKAFSSGSRPPSSKNLLRHASGLG